MEQEKPDIDQARKFAENVTSDPMARGVFFSMNLSPSFNWSSPDNWKALTVAQKNSIKEALKDPLFRWSDERTWKEHKPAIDAMMGLIDNFSIRLGEAG